MIGTRPANPQEIAAARRFETAIAEGRKKVAAYLGLAGCLALAEEWRRAEVRSGRLDPGAFPPLFTAGQVEEARAVAGNWNRLEDALTALYTQRFGIQAHNKDIDIYDLEAKPETQQGLGLPVLVVIVGAGVLISGAIALAVKWATDAERKAADFNARILEINSKMAAEPREIRESWRRLQQSAPYQQQRSFWESLKGGTATIALLSIAGLALYGFYSGRQAIKRRRRIENPCGSGAISDPYSWKVRWSDDPAKLERQLDHVLDNLGNKGAQRYRHFFDPLIEEIETAAEIGGDLELIEEIGSYDYDEEIPF